MHACTAVRHHRTSNIPVLALFIWMPVLRGDSPDASGGKALLASWHSRKTQLFASDWYNKLSSSFILVHAHTANIKYTPHYSKYAAASRHG